MFQCRSRNTLQHCRRESIRRSTILHDGISRTRMPEGTVSYRGRCRSSRQGSGQRQLLMLMLMLMLRWDQKPSLVHSRGWLLCHIVVPVRLSQRCSPSIDDAGERRYRVSTFIRSSGPRVESKQSTVLNPARKQRMIERQCADPGDEE